MQPHYEKGTFFTFTSSINSSKSFYDLNKCMHLFISIDRCIYYFKCLPNAVSSL